MRLIGHLADEQAARTFGDFLYVSKIDNRIEHEKADGWAVWVNDEDRIAEASQLLNEFRVNPADPKYRSQAKSASGLRAEAEKSQARWVKKLQDRRHLFRPFTAYGFGPVTFVLIVLSVVVSIMSRFGANLQPVAGLFITESMGHSALPEVMHGQVWRLATPIFLPFGILHIFFNLMWLRDLGSMIEARQSSWLLVVMVLVIAVGSNLAQFWLSGPIFGGLSGVVYGLLGYIWMRGKFDPGSGLFLHPTTVTMMIIWFVLCFTPIVPHVANGTHAVGLAIGVAWGYLSSLRYR